MVTLAAPVREDPSALSNVYFSHNNPRDRKKRRKELPTIIKDTFRPEDPLAVYRDRKILPKIIGTEKEDCLMFTNSGVWRWTRTVTRSS